MRGAVATSGTSSLPTIQGYSGPIQLCSALDAGERHHRGAGARARPRPRAWARRSPTTAFLDQFTGKARAEVALKKDDPAGAIDAIAAATISSRAVDTGLRATLEAFQKGELKTKTAGTPAGTHQGHLQARTPS